MPLPAGHRKEFDELLRAFDDRGLEWAEAFLHEHRHVHGDSRELTWALDAVAAVRAVTKQRPPTVSP